VTQDDPYLYRGSAVLKNKLGITDAALLDYRERELVLQRAMEPIPTGQFDLRHLRAIHRHLFQDVYSWAGKIRTVEIAKGGHQFQFRRFIETGMADIHRRLIAAGFLRHMDAPDFARAAGAIIGDVNYVHPFRDGNGRTQLCYLKQLGAQAGHTIDLAKLSLSAWIAASVAAHAGDYRPMSEAIGATLLVHE
jgi:cell filamentation protein